jgi:hypothetical protein
VYGCLILRETLRKKQIFGNFLTVFVKENIFILIKRLRVSLFQLASSKKKKLVEEEVIPTYLFCQKFVKDSSKMAHTVEKKRPQKFIVI